VASWRIRKKEKREMKKKKKTIKGFLTNPETSIEQEYEEKLMI
jgi:hypothetical protein